MPEHKFLCGNFTFVVRYQSATDLEIFCEEMQKQVFSQAMSEQATIAETAKTTKNKSIDHYEIIKKLSEGGMGEIFLAQDTRHNCQVVLKTIKNYDTNANTKAVEKATQYFLREAQVLSQMKHNNMVQFVGCGNANGTPYMAMEFINGRDVNQILRENMAKEQETKKPQRMKISQVLQIVYQVADAVEYAHNNFSLVHRDIKPHNILLLDKSTVHAKLIDFGLAKMLDEYQTSLTGEGAAMGTPCYMPQEQIRNAKYANHRSDVYSLGASMYHMIGGRPPYFHKQGSIAIMMAVEQQDIISIRELQPGLPDGLYKIIEKAMAQHEKNRFQTMAELKQAISSFVKSVQ